MLCYVLSVIFCFIRYTAGTCVFTIVVSLDFTSGSSDYVLSQPGLFSTKLTLSIIAQIQLFYKI